MRTLVAAILSGLASAQSLTPITVVLPAPTGPYAIGTTSFTLVDSRRAESLGDAPGPRQVRVVAWYPAAADATGPVAPYLREGEMEARGFASLMRQPEGALDYLAQTRTHAILEATPRAGERFPVLLFSHGYTAIASSHTALVEDLASHGYAVLSIVHPYEAMAAMLANGEVALMLDGQKQMRPGIREVLGEWGKEDETMAAVTKAGSEAEALALMRGYLGTLARTTDALTRWVDDTTFVFDRRRSWPAGAAARLAARLDDGRMSALGHSMGGVTAAAFCAAHDRCRAALNLDGIPQYGPLIDRPGGKPLLMVYSGRAGRLGASDVISRRATTPYVRVDVADTLHLDFTDMILWGGPLAKRPMFGTLPGERAVALTRQIVREYVDQQLRGRPSPLLTGKVTIDGVRVQGRAAPAPP